MFDSFYDSKEGSFKEWKHLIALEKEPEIDTTKNFTKFIIPTTSSVPVQFLLRKFISVGQGSLLVGNSGCGKTSLTKNLLNDLEKS